MRYKLLGLAIVLLISTPSAAFAQRMSPIIVKTGKPVPSVVRSGEPFKITYQVTYIDAVLIIEEHMRLNSLTLLADDSGKLKLENSITGDVEVISLEIGEKVRDGSDEMGFINVQDFTYTFMIIDEKKGTYKIPSFDFVYILKKAGTTVAKAKDKAELKKFPTKGVGISYVTTIVSPPPIDARDSFQYDNFEFETLATKASIFGYGTIGAASLLALIMVARFYRQPRTKKTDDSKNAVENGNENVVYAVTSILTLRKARKKFLQGLKVLEDELKFVAVNDRTEKVIGEKLYLLVRMFVLAELSEGAVKASGAHTPKEIYELLVGLNDKQKKYLGRKYGAIIELTRRSKNYYESIESGSRFTDPEREIGELRHIIENIDLRRKLYSVARSLVQKTQIFVKKTQLFVKSRVLRR